MTLHWKRTFLSSFIRVCFARFDDNGPSSSGVEFLNLNLFISFIGHGPSYKKLKFFPLGCFVLSVFEIETEIEIEIWFWIGRFFIHPFYVTLISSMKRTWSFIWTNLKTHFELITMVVKVLIWPHKTESLLIQIFATAV